jgi:hypothetical protein
MDYVNARVRFLVNGPEAMTTVGAAADKELCANAATIATLKFTAGLLSLTSGDQEGANLAGVVGCFAFF